ncbi:unnamed protein product [Cuscuta epithymum]|uniref:PHD and RING finger domain-containing protein 1 n=1 Tax=Cuscuta epithymum TaxID=186058 RepID=A0AAV0GAV3_9ASTE|nr:unnamed protein product [Cuscuta epithymum]
MAKKGKARQYTDRRRVRSDHKYDDEQSDEDYCVSENELFDCSEDESFSLVADTSGVSLGDCEDSEEDEIMNVKQKKVVKKNDAPPKAQNRQKSIIKQRKRKRVMYKEDDEISDDSDDDGDYEEEDEAEEEEEFIPNEINGVVKRKTRDRFIYRDDDDDVDFTPDEINSTEEEEEEEEEENLHMMRGNKKMVKRKLTKNNRKRVQGKTISKVSKKTRKKTSKVSKQINRKGARKTCRKNYSQEKRERRLIIDSDSDFVSCASSDHEYIISEEESEQIREANKLCRGLRDRSRIPGCSTDARLSDRSMIPGCSTDAPQGKTSQHQKKRSLRKGKEKVAVVEELKKSDGGKQVCGICFSEEEKKTINGMLNCCSHYFCFACIMEWSKVESRCPLCKQRFVTITKDAKSPSPRTVVIHVPERDQVYVPSEEELRGYLDPYENVICTECQQGGDDAHMLLCDICDSPAHTYCVGLGSDVPEGDWYCEACRLASPRFQNPENSNPTGEDYYGRLPSIATSRKESCELDEMYVPETPLAQQTFNTSSPRDNQSGSSSASRSVAYTVSRRRRIHRQISRFISNNRMRWAQNGDVTTGG